MSQTDQEKTEEATPRKREDAREEGQIPRSAELTTAVLLLVAALTVNALGPALATSMSSTMGYGLTLAGAAPMDSESAVGLVREMGWKVLAALTATMLALAGSSLAIAGVQARGVLTTKPLEPKWERLSPMANAKRMVGMQPLMELVKSLLKLAIVGLVVWFSLSSAWPESIALAQQTPRELVDVVRSYSVRLLMSAGLAYLALAGADYFYQLWQHEKNLRMSKEEVKQEHKQNEGDPLVKAQRRALGRALMRRQMFQEVQNADVVITNPTHIAVALKYDPDKADAPVVLAIGQRKIAERIKALAKEAGVPMVENKPLARALLATAKVGMMIPPELYMAVAEVLAFVMSQRRPSSSGSSS